MRVKYIPIILTCMIGSSSVWAIDASTRPLTIQDSMNRCVVKATTPIERRNIAKWILSLQMQEQPQAAPSLVSQDQLSLLKNNAQSIFHRLSDECCRSEIHGAILSMGNSSAQEMINYLYSTAIQELIADHPVEVDKNDLEKKKIEKFKTSKIQPKEIDRLVTSNIPIESNIVLQRESLENRAKDGDKKAQYMMGQLCSEGIIYCDFTETVKWFKLAADQGDSDAQNNLGIAYYRGIGLPRDFKQAASLFRLAADQSNPKAQYNLATLYIVANGIGQDFAESAKWYLKSAEQGFSPAQVKIGDDYADGIGVDKDWDKAFMWYWRAANQGDIQGKARVASGASNYGGLTAQYQYARMLESGYCFDENNTMAYALYSRVVSVCEGLGERTEAKTVMCHAANISKEKLAVRMNKSELELAKELIDDAMSTESKSLLAKLNPVNHCRLN